MIVRALGPVEVVDDSGTVVSIGSRAQRVVLSVLAASAPATVSSDVLVDAVWGDAPPPSAASSLRTYVSRLRHILGDGLEIRPGGYSLGIHTDIDAFERLVARATRAEPVALEPIEDALDLWRGPVFGDVAEVEALTGARVRLEELRGAACEHRARALLARGRASEAVALSEEVVSEHPYREGAWAVLVEALAAECRPAEALRAHHRAVTVLADAGLVPSEPLRRAERTALSSEPSPEATPVASLAGRGRHLPASLSATVGRDDDLLALESQLGSARLVTLVGPGGVGKTRLAVELARRVEQAHEHGGRLVELAGVREPDAVPGLVASALGLTVDAGSPTDTLARAGDLDAVVVLDNCEHVVDAAADAASTMLRGGGRVRIVATSRERLAIEGEHVWPVAPLAVGGPDTPAASLFLDRARAANPRLSIDDAGRAAVARIVARLDGLPLALEMAAARAAVMALPELADRLESRLDLLESNRRDQESRHATLGALVEWSEALLDVPDLALLRDLSVVAGMMPADDIAAITGHTDVQGSLTRLVDRSLVVADVSGEEATFGLLSTIREHAASRLSPARAADLSRRHAEHVAAVARRQDRRLRGPEEDSAHRRLSNLLDELLLAHRWAAENDRDLAYELAGSLHLFAQSRLLDEPLRWASTLVERDGAHLPAAATTALTSAAHRSLTLGDGDRGLALASRAVELAETPAERCAALEIVADAHLFAGDLDAVRLVGDEMRGLARVAGDLYLEVLAHVSLVLAAGYAGDVAAAEASLREAPRADGLGPSAAAWLAYAEGEAVLDRDVARALRALDRAVALAESVGNRYVAGVARLSACSLRGRALDPRRAARAYADVIAHWRREGAHAYQVTTLRNLVHLLRRLDDPGHAAELIATLDVASQQPTFGEEAERLASVRAEVHASLGGDESERRAAVGRRRSVDEAAGAALGWLAVERAE